MIVPAMRLDWPRKLATKVVAGFSYSSVGCTHLLDDAVVHDRDGVGHRHGLFLVVGHVHKGDADLALNLLELDLHRAAQLEVERAERLVEQQHLWAVDERARKRDTLLLATGELLRPLVRLHGQLGELEHVLDLLVRVLLASPLEAKLDVLARS